MNFIEKNELNSIIKEYIISSIILNERLDLNDLLQSKKGKEIFLKGAEEFKNRFIDPNAEIGNFRRAPDDKDGLGLVQFDIKLPDKEGVLEGWLWIEEGVGTGHHGKKRDTYVHLVGDIYMYGEW